MSKLVSPLLCLLLTGCNVLQWSSRHARPAGPPLPMSMTREELIEHLNDQSGRLESWQSFGMKMSVRMPGHPLPLNLQGQIACKSPNHFNLRATHTLGAMLDLGANADSCWVLMNPSETGTISWRHEDSHLIRELDSNVPYIDPEWLMLVMGVKRLNPDDYRLGRSTDPRRPELWLTSDRVSAGTGIERYVIKVDRQRRVITEHVAYDHRGQKVATARLRNYRSFDGHLLPTTVDLSFGHTGASMSLNFRQIEANPEIDTALWVVPSDPFRMDVNLSEMAAQDPRFLENLKSGRKDTPPPIFDSDRPLEEPVWDTPTSQTPVVRTGYQEGTRGRPSIWRRVLDPFNFTGYR